MKKILIASAVAAISCSIPAYAGGLAGAAGANVGVGVGAGGAGVGANVNAGANANANAGGRGPSVTATENSNGQFAADREYGQARAAERMSVQGSLHERASTAPNKKRPQKPELPQTGAEAAGSLSGQAAARTR